MMNSLKLKGIQLSPLLTGLDVLIVSFGVGRLTFQIIIKNGMRPPMPTSDLALEDPKRPHTRTRLSPKESGKASLQFRRQQSFTGSAKKLTAGFEFI